MRPTEATSHRVCSVYVFMATRVTTSEINLGFHLVHGHVRGGIHEMLPIHFENGFVNRLSRDRQQCDQISEPSPL